MRSTASARLSVTVEPLTATALVAASATVRSVPDRVAFTVNALAAGFDISSRSPSKVSVSAAPSTDALLNAGGVTFVATLFRARGASLPDRSFSRFVASFVTSYDTRTVWPCRAGVWTVTVTVRPEIDGGLRP